MPTTITGQNGVRIVQSTHISVAGCPAAPKCVKVLKRRLVRHKLKLKVRVCAAGRLSARGKYLTRASHRVRRASTMTLTLSLTRKGVGALRRHHPLKIRVALSFVPSRHGMHRASAATTIAFRR